MSGPVTMVGTLPSGWEVRASRDAFRVTTIRAVGPGGEQVLIGEIRDIDLVEANSIEINLGDVGRLIAQRPEA